jgi:uncharacterized membrane protein YhiD involved in acid resistance
MSDLLNQALSFRESSTSLTVEAIVLGLLAAYALSQTVAWVYLWTHRGISHSSSLTQSLVVLSVIVALVMLVIGSNLARAFGLFGALALIRFRTPVKDSRDTVFLFLSVAIGIAAGTGHVVAAALGTVVCCLILLFLAASNFGNRQAHHGVVRLTLPPEDGPEALLMKAFRRYCSTFRLVHVRETGRGGTTEHAYEIKLAHPEDGAMLAAEVRTIDGVEGLSVLLSDAEATP